jgi:D-alanyl-D-alanine dipeptidase
MDSSRSGRARSQDVNKSDQWVEERVALHGHSSGDACGLTLYSTERNVQ